MKKMMELQSTRLHRITVQQVELIIFQQKIAQVQVFMTQPSLGQLLEQPADLVGNMPAIWNRVSAQVELVEMLIELDRRLNGLKNDGIAKVLIDPKPHQCRDRARRANLSFLQELKLLELRHRGAAAKDPPETIAKPAPTIELR